MGRPPWRRTEAVSRYLHHRYKSELEGGCLFIGGHSLGGLVASLVSHKLQVPAVLNNTPGCLGREPEGFGALAVNIATVGCLVGDWGHVPRLMLKVNCPSKNPLRLHSIDEQLVFLRSCPWGEKSMKSALVELSHMYVQALAENEDVSSLSSSENKSNKSKHEEENEKNSNPETITFISETFRSYMGLQKKVTTAAADVVKETVKETFREQIQDLHLLDDIKKGQFKNVPSALSGVVAKTSTVLSTKAVKTVLKVKTGITDEVDKIKLKTKAK